MRELLGVVASGIAVAQLSFVEKKHLAELNTDPVIADENVDMDVDLTILPKAWMRLKGMHIKQSRRFGCWTCSFRPVRVVHDDSPIFRACKNGDIGKILQLFAALHLRAELCRWLLAQGVQATETGIDEEETALHIASYHVDKDDREVGNSSSMRFQCVENKGRHNDAMETIRVLIEVGQYDPMRESKVGETSLHWYTGGAEPFDYMLNQESFPIGLDPQDGIVSILECHIEAGTHCFADTIIKFMMEKSIKFSEARLLRNGFPSCPLILHTFNTTDIICNFELYDCRDQESSFKLSNSLQKPKMPGAWESDAGLIDYPEFTASEIWRPSRSPDFEISQLFLFVGHKMPILSLRSFVIGPLIDGEQKFDHISSIRRRGLACKCFCFLHCPPEPQFGRYDVEIGELDLCSCLEKVRNDGSDGESGCKCEDEHTNDDGSEFESEVESIDESNEYEDRSDCASQVESENESINDSNQHEKDQKADGV
ncbi:uncharacterized protein Bfra_007676ib [Botrytis fragariae]|uniref:Ankyrin repeat protein n=1 Tax=Botrytis fragariae TaxID=1964551 RepID=A0A8H6ANU0_9HELO|nr:uncharacterized protein Bfra_007676ib [Botrytis fragariae]KAF5871163.1 hypothetical protein Bfra_007676ib [Botrytis fragariae]